LSNFAASNLKTFFFMSSENTQHGGGHGTKHIIQSLIVNLIIAACKSVAAFMTNSGAMLAEAIHSFADCANQALLYVGVKQAQRPADEKHPLGYGRSVYFWSFMVALLLFSVGGMFSVYEGVHKFTHPEPVEHIMWGVGILIFSIVLEGYATYSNVIEMNQRRGNTAFFKYLKQTKDSDLVVIFGENSAAVLGLVLALGFMLASYFTNDGRYDAIGSLLIGLVLIGVAIFLSREVKSLLIGESADPIIEETARQAAIDHPCIKELLNCITMQQGPGEVLVCVKIKCEPQITALQVSQLINEFEDMVRSKCPEVKWLYVEPDLQEWQ
jgi:cation diffusion facilitator family transporter